MSMVTASAPERNTQLFIEATPATVKPVTPLLSREAARVRWEYPEKLATTQGLTPAQIRVLLVLWRSGYGSGEARYHQTTIAGMLKLSPCEVSRAVAKSAALDLVQVIRGQRGVRYRLPWHPEFSAKGDSLLAQNRKSENSPLAEKRKSDLRKSASGKRSTLYSPSKAQIESSSSSAEPAAAELAKVNTPDRTQPPPASGGPDQAKTATVAPAPEKVLAPELQERVLQALNRIVKDGVPVGWLPKVRTENANVGGNDESLIAWASSRDPQSIRHKGGLLRILAEDVPGWLVKCHDYAARMTPTPISENPTESCARDRRRRARLELQGAIEDRCVVHRDGFVDEPATNAKWNALRACPTCHGYGRTEAGEFCTCAAGTMAHELAPEIDRRFRIIAASPKPTPMERHAQDVMHRYRDELRSVVLSCSVVHRDGFMDEAATQQEWRALESCPTCRGYGTTKSGAMCTCKAGEMAREISPTIESRYFAQATA